MPALGADANRTLQLRAGSLTARTEFGSVLGVWIQSAAGHCESGSRYTAREEEAFVSMSSAADSSVALESRSTRQTERAAGLSPTRRLQETRINGRRRALRASKRFDTTGGNFNSVRLRVVSPPSGISVSWSKPGSPPAKVVRCGPPPAV